MNKSWGITHFSNLTVKEKSELGKQFEQVGELQELLFFKKREGYWKKPVK